MTNITESTTTTATPGKPTTRRRMTARKVAIVLAALTSFVGVGLSSSEPAQAASGLSYCFRHASGGAYTHEVFLMIYKPNSGWTAVQNLGIVGRTGCGSVNIGGAWRNYPTRVVAYKWLPNSVFYGQTPYYGSAGSSTYNLGTGIVNG